MKKITVGELLDLYDAKQAALEAAKTTIEIKPFGDEKLTIGKVLARAARLERRKAEHRKKYA